MVAAAIAITAGWKIAQLELLGKSAADRAERLQAEGKNAEVRETEPGLEEQGKDNEAGGKASGAVEGQENKLHIPGLQRQDYSDGSMIISIPRLKVTAAVVDGTEEEVLKKGPGLYEISPLPGEEEGNICIAGHRTSYGAWFAKIDRLSEGDDIILEFGGFKFIYKVEKVFAVYKKDWSVTKPAGYPAVTLTTCHPPGSAEQRLVARGRLAEIKPE